MGELMKLCSKSLRFVVKSDPTGISLVKIPHRCRWLSVRGWVGFLPNSAVAKNGPLFWIDDLFFEFGQALVFQMGHVGLDHLLKVNKVLFFGEQRSDWRLIFVGRVTFWRRISALWRLINPSLFITASDKHLCILRDNQRKSLGSVGFKDCARL